MVHICTIKTKVVELMLSPPIADDDDFVKEVIYVIIFGISGLSAIAQLFSLTGMVIFHVYLVSHNMTHIEYNCCKGMVTPSPPLTTTTFRSLFLHPEGAHVRRRITTGRWLPIQPRHPLQLARTVGQYFVLVFFPTTYRQVSTCLPPASEYS